MSGHIQGDRKNKKWVYGTLATASEEHPFLGREIAQPRRYSEHSAEAVDHAVQTLLLEAEQRARTVLKEHKAELEHLIITLKENETLHREQIEQCLGPVERNRSLGAR